MSFRRGAGRQPGCLARDRDPRPGFGEPLDSPVRKTSPCQGTVRGDAPRTAFQTRRRGGGGGRLGVGGAGGLRLWPQEGGTGERGVRASRGCLSPRHADRQLSQGQRFFNGSGSRVPQILIKLEEVGDGGTLGAGGPRKAITQRKDSAAPGR